MLNECLKNEDFSTLEGKTLVSTQLWSNYGHDGVFLTFETACGAKYSLFHKQMCCESVMLEDVVGDLDDLVGTPIVSAEESSENHQRTCEEGYLRSVQRYTFYHLRTHKGDVTLRFNGESNGYYSVAVSFGQHEDVEDFSGSEDFPCMEE